MITKLRLITLATVAVGWSGATLALPSAQLDIGGTNVFYDPVTQSVMTSDPQFTLYGYGLTATGPGKALDTSLDWYVSIALVPQTAAGTDFGSFSFDGVTYDTNDMTAGIPPLDTMLMQQGLLPQHSVYPTLYTLAPVGAVVWDPTQTRAAVDVQTTQGTSPTANPGTDLMWQGWSVNVAGLSTGFNLHFDLFGVQCPSGNAAGDFTGCTVEQFAPFSHDAQTRVPEPETLTLLGFGLLLVGFAARRRRQAV